MRVLVAFDKFKGALSASRACDAAAAGLRRLHPTWHLDLCPLTDGGEGFTEILTTAARGRQVAIRATGARGGLVEAGFGLVESSRIPPAVRPGLDLPSSLPPGPIAVVEMAAASGLEHLAPAMRDPWQTTSHGTGQLIRAAAESGAAAILLGVGGSATIDLGLGALSALGMEFRSAAGGILRPPYPARWADIAGIEGGLFPSIPPIAIACDVTNPVLGPNGAAAVYGPQKGLQADDLARFEATLQRMVVMLCRHCGRPTDLADTPGAGAAGGVPFGLMTAARARLVPGFGLVSAWLDLESRIAAADVVLTGEGRFDRSSLSGKGPGAVAAAARRAGRPVHLFAGAIEGDRPDDPDLQVHAITPAEYPLDRALREAAGRLMHCVREAFPAADA